MISGVPCVGSNTEYVANIRLRNDDVFSNSLGSVKKYSQKYS